MRTLELDEALEQLPLLAERAVPGDSFLITKAGRVVFRVETIEQRNDSDLHSLRKKGAFVFPERREDFKAIGAEDIELMNGE